MSDVAHEAYRPAIEDGRGIFPEDFRLKAPRGFNDAVRAAAQRQHMTRAEYARRALLRSYLAKGIDTATQARRKKHRYRSAMAV